MNTIPKLFATGVLLAGAAASGAAAVYYVDVNSASPTPPYTNWATAATNIQDAVDAAVAGDEIVVTNGTYHPVAVGRPLSVRSINGAQSTTIDGGGSVRCVYLASGATLSGFTLRNGFVFADNGGGAYGGTLNNCWLTHNSASVYYDYSVGGNGGGAYSCTLNNCTLTGNSASGYYYYYDTVGGNGGGAYSCTLNNCALTGNSASASYYYYYGGGGGGGAYSCTLNNCTLTGNSAPGAAACMLTNCLVYFNRGWNYDSCGLNYCCTTPLPASGVGNISSDPQLASASHLSALSPCIGKGSYAAVSGTDIDAEPWANPPSIGCDEYHAGAVTGPLTVNITASLTRVVGGYPVNFTALIDGRTDFSIWDFGDGALEINQPYTAHSWATPGDYLVSLWAFNDTYPGGISTNIIIHVVTGLHYVAANSTNPVAPYASWATAARNIQDAINAAEPGATVMVVSNGSYGPINIPAPMTVRSVNGPQFTTINGGGSSRCAILAASATLSGFTLANGLSKYSQYSSAGEAQGGGGAYGGTLTNCALTGNRASGYYQCSHCYDPQCGCWRSDCYPCYYVGAVGGGASSCTLNNCTLSGNSAYSGGGAYGCALNNCILTGNSTANPGGIDSSTPDQGGGAYNCTLNNCTLAGNSSSNDGGGAYSCTLNNCALAGNSAAYGGGAYYCTLNNCSLTGNSYGGAVHSTLHNCTLTGNSVGVASCTLTNCIAYFNSGANYDPSCTLNYSCTTPLPTNGVGNISSDPQLASASHLSALSPCIAKGSYAAVSGTDIDGEPWANPPSIGCDEYHAGGVTGPLSVAITASLTNVAVGYPVAFTAVIEGRTDLSVWDFGDGVTATNQPYTAHWWATPGDYLVSLWAFNDSYPGGISATMTVHVVLGLHYVAANSANPVAPYTSWTTAATNIQDAINAALEPGAQVVVTNGTYAPITAYGHLSVRSLNGAQFTIVDGGLSNRCASLGNGVSLTGLTLTNGYARGNSGGGAFGGTLNNCTLSGNSAADSGGGAYSSTLNNCTLAGNIANDGGGAAYSSLNNCTLTGNSVNYYSGGGASYSTLNNCTLKGNSAIGIYGSGGGAYSCTLSNCTMMGNWTHGGGGGAYSCTLNNCTLNGNRATGTSGSGGGAYSSTLRNCALTGNSAALSGGAVYSCFVNNCTLTGNSASGTNGGGACSSTLNNCILYYNTAPRGTNYDSSSTLNYCCTRPLPAGGTNNTDAEPRLASASHLSASSPCIGRGSAAYASGVDIDGEPWANPPSIGCDEYYVGAITGALSMGISVPFTNITRGFSLGFTALIEGRATASSWDFADGATVSNQPYASHAWTSVGDYAVVLRAYNESLPGGISATVTVHVLAAPPVYYVAAANTNPVTPYLSWATAATNIQDAVDAASVPGALVLVTDGIYSTGGLTLDGAGNRVAVNKPLSLQSVNGPQFTIIDGASSVRCVYLANGASLAGFTLTNGWVGPQDGGGGVNGGAVSNCVLTRNWGGYGAGARDCILNNCALTNNSANYNGGGAYGCTLSGCSLAGNSASGAYGGGAYSCILSNCLLATNSVFGANSSYGGGAYSSTLDNCTLAGNSAPALYGIGGGASASTLNNCTLTANSSTYSGGGASSCTLNNCSLTGNSAQYGGGVYGGTLNNCTLTANSGISSGGGASGGTLNNCSLTRNSSPNGGGAAGCTLNNCILTGNSADNSGGGAEGCILNNCTVAGNSATGSYGGGGVSYCTLNNCIVYFNFATNGPNFDTYGTLNYCCTTPLPYYGFGNITNAPLLGDTNGWANLRLQSNSPCINAGNDSYVTNATDLDGNPRIVGGTVDIGAYEFQAPVSQISYAWLQQYGLPINSSTDTADPDGDGVDNYHEWLAGTNPTNSLSSPAQLTITPSGVPPSGIILRWSTNAVGFTLQSTTNLLSPASWVTNSPSPVVINAQNTVTNPITGGQQFYRLIH